MKRWEAGPKLAANELASRVLGGMLLDEDQARGLAEEQDVDRLVSAAGSIRDAGHGDIISYSKKVFIPLTHLCRDSCHYCTFAHPPKANESAFLRPDQVLEIARAGAAASCREALFTLGDKPELRYQSVKLELEQLGHASTFSYLREMAALVQSETGLFPHLNPGVMTRADVESLRQVSVSQGLMLETVSERLSRRGGPHFGSPDKLPEARLATIRAAGEAVVPFTSGILIGIGETRSERIDALLKLRALNSEFGHLQEIIIQNFRAKPGTRMAGVPEPSFKDHLWTVAVARLIFGPESNIQAPPNLSAGALSRLIAAGINDWGGISPVTPDHVNPEAPWPALSALAEQTRRCGKTLVERLGIYPSYVLGHERWLAREQICVVLNASDAAGLARVDDWTPGARVPLGNIGKFSQKRCSGTGMSKTLRDIISRAIDGLRLEDDDIVTLFSARGDAFDFVCESADELRKTVSGDTVGYVVNRNINYTNVCSYRCQFCAFSKGRLSASSGGRAYDLDLNEIKRRAVEAWARGATEVCLQGGIHPGYTGQTYLSILGALKEACPQLHVHAFSPLEVWQGAATLGISVRAFLRALRDAGLGSLPGTAAEILDDDVRAVICPDKVTTAEWLSIVETAHELGLPTTSTIMFGHIDHPRHWARHLLSLRTLQERTGGLTEFVPLPFVPMEAPIYLKGRARRGPTIREALLMHAIARLALNPLVPNIQTSWVKMGAEGASRCLQAGANDLGGTLMNESISSAAGAQHGQEMTPERMERMIREIGRAPRTRTTLYGDARRDRRNSAFGAPELTRPVYQAAGRTPRILGETT